MMGKLRAMMRRSLRAGLRPVLDLTPRGGSRRTVLLACGKALQADFLAEIWDLLKPDPRLTFRLMMPFQQDGPRDFERIRRTLPVPEVGSCWAHLAKWDLIVLADHHFSELGDGRRCPIVRISHGFPGKRVDGKVYAFGPRAYTAAGRIRYTRMFVPSEAVRDLAVNADPAFADVVAVVGSPGDDKMLAEAGRRNEYRARFGFRPDDVVVFITATWGPHSLFCRMGDAILARARELQGQFRFILSAHSLEYRPRPAGERVWGEYLREQRRYGFLVREPSENWTPYMIASDILVTDHTSLALHGALLGLPFVCSPIPEEIIEPDSIIGQIRDVSPRLQDDASNLPDALAAARNGYPLDRLHEIALRMNSRPHQSAELIRGEFYRQLRLSPTV